MCTPAKIKKLDTVVVNRIAAGEVIQRPANALKELIENSLDAKSNNIQITVKEGGLKLLQIQDNGTGIRKDDMDIVCERFTTSKLQNFEDLRSIATFGFRGEALASISHVALLTITTKTVDEKCAYKASYVDGKLKAPPKPCAGNQGTTILIENLFYNVTTRRKALKNTSEEFSKIVDVVTKYAIHNPMVGFTLKKHGEVNTHVRTAHNSTKVNNIRALFSNAIARELLEIEHKDDTYKFNLQALITNPNYSSKRMTFMLFINNRLVDSSPIRKMLEDLYSIYLPKKTYPWCYVSLEINPNNVDVNVHPTKHEVRFLHEDAIIEKVKIALDEKLASNNASRTFYIQARLPKVDITKDTLKEVLPEYDKNDTDKSKKIHPREMIRTDSSDQKLDKFNFTLQAKDALNKNLESVPVELMNFEDSETSTMNREVQILDGKVQAAQRSDNILSSNESFGNFSENIDALQLAQSEFVTSTQVEKDKDTLDTPNLNRDVLECTYGELETSASESVEDSCSDGIANQALKRVYQYLGNRGNMDYAKTMIDKDDSQIKNNKENNSATGDCSQNEPKEEAESSFRKEEQSFPMQGNVKETKSAPVEFKSHSVNNFKREVKLTSVLKLRKQVEDDYHEGLREILSNLIFVGCVDETFALIQSGVNLYICNTQALTEELFYEIMLYDFANYGVIRFSEPIPLYDLAMLGLDSEEAGWSIEDGSKEDLANNVKELLLEKADMMKEYFSIVIDKRGNLKSLPILVDKYFPCEAGLPLYILRLATEVNWKEEQPCFRDVCRETAKFFSQVNSNDGKHDWKHVTEHILYPTIKGSLLPPKQFAHDSTILQIASLPDLYKIFERC